MNIQDIKVIINRFVFVNCRRYESPQNGDPDGIADYFFLWYNINVLNFLFPGNRGETWDMSGRTPGSAGMIEGSGGLIMEECRTLSYRASESFSPSMLTPIAQNLAEKRKRDWDDYDELAHCLDLIEETRQLPDAHMVFHTAVRGEDVVGILIITTGTGFLAGRFPPGFSVGVPEQRCAVLNYFHVSPDARGIGEHWLREIVLPSVAAMGKDLVLVKSSHPKSFSLYRRLGREVGSYSAKSDHGLLTREGRIFAIPLSGGGGNDEQAVLAVQQGKGKT